MNLYLIYNPKTNKFSRGGTYVKWSNSPKVWSRTCDFHNHLTLNYKPDGTPYLNNVDPYKGCEVVIINIDTMNIQNIAWNAYQR